MQAEVRRNFTVDEYYRWPMSEYSRQQTELNSSREIIQMSLLETGMRPALTGQPSLRDGLQKKQSSAFSAPLDNHNEHVDIIILKPRELLRLPVTHSMDTFSSLRSPTTLRYDPTSNSPSMREPEWKFGLRISRRICC
jgi:hypothetical protein